MGWCGLKRELLFYLDTVGADRDFEGNFLIDTKPIVAGMDTSEVVVPDETRYFVKGEPKALAAGLNTTSYGINVKVF